MTALPVRLAHQLDIVAPEQRWLIEGLWGAEAVGIIGGEPKCCKSFLALDMAVAVASVRIPKDSIAQSARIRSLIPEDSIRDRSAATNRGISQRAGWSVWP